MTAKSQTALAWLRRLALSRPAAVCAVAVVCWGAFLLVSWKLATARELRSAEQAVRSSLAHRAQSPAAAAAQLVQDPALKGVVATVVVRAKARSFALGAAATRGPAIDVSLGSAGSLRIYVSPSFVAARARQDFWPLAALVAVMLAIVAIVAAHPRAAPVPARRLARRNDHRTDPLTGLLNRAGFDELATALIRRRARLTLLLLDLDRFKQVNDTLGHANGDSVLKQIAARLKVASRDGDVLARLGGDEFAIVLGDVESKNDARLVAERVASSLDAPIVVGGLSIRVEASIGIAIAPDHGRKLSQLTHAADVAMYAAKRGDTSYAFYSRDLDAVDTAALSLVGELRRAMNEQELRLVYQPKLDLATGAVTSVEALARWEHPSRGLLAPGSFIPLAEQSNLLNPLTLHLAEMALKQANRWSRHDPPIKVAFNLSARNLLDSALPHDLYKLVADWRIPTARLELEITESTIMSDPTRAQRVLQTLHNMGFSLAIDDYGTGYSSLAYIQRLPVSTLKIDRSFVADIPENQANAEIVRSTITMAHNLGLEVVAEGVETAEAMNYLKAIGCDRIQGYLVSKPVPAEQLTAWLSALEALPRPAPRQPGRSDAVQIAAPAAQLSS